MKERNKRNTAADGRETGRRPGSREEGFREGRSGFRKGSPWVKGFRKGAEWKMPALLVLLLAAAVLVVILVAALWNRSSTPETIQEDEIWSETIPGDGSSSENASKETAEGWEKIPEDRKAENKISGESDSDAESTGLPIMTGESAAASKKDGAAASGASKKEGTATSGNSVNASGAGNSTDVGNSLATGNTAAAGNGLATGNTAASGSDSVAGNSVASGSAGNASSVGNAGGTGNTVTSGSTGTGGTGVTGSSGSTSGTGTPGTTVQPGENKNPVREPGNVVVEEGGNESFHQRDSESVELPFDFVDE